MTRLRGEGRRGGGRWGLLGRAFLLAVAFGMALGDEKSQRYADGEEVKVWVNKVGPFDNPQETYAHYSLPFCKVNPDEKVVRWAGLGEALEGNSLVKSDYTIKFREILTEAKVCSTLLRRDAAAKFGDAVRNNYWYNMWIDELPLWAMVGEVSNYSSTNVEAKEYIYAHKHFSIAYHGDRIIEVNLTSERPTLIEPDISVDFSYSVDWIPTSRRFDQRFNRYLDHDFFEHQIRWFSLFNSFMMVLFLVGLVALILVRTLRNDYKRYAKMDEEDPILADAGDEFGWKQVQGDVFRFPPRYPILCALIGTGTQLTLMVYGTTVLSIIGTLYIGRGAVSSTAILVFALSSIASGFVSGRHYSKCKGKEWIKTMIFACTGFNGAAAAVLFALNFIAVSYDSLAAVPAGTVVALFLIWALVSCPLCLLGTIIGRNTTTPWAPSCRVTQIPRQIPEKAWYLQPFFIIPLGGLLPFGSIYIEMYFVFTSFWNGKFYYVYGFLLLVFTILIVVTACVCIVITYFHLNAEDWRWPWTSFLSGASTSLYLLAYATYFFFAKTRMHGLMQTCFYFGHMAMVGASLAIVCGTVGYFASRAFVVRIYSNVKTD